MIWSFPRDKWDFRRSLNFRGGRTRLCAVLSNEMPNVWAYTLEVFLPRAPSTYNSGQNKVNVRPACNSDSPKTKCKKNGKRKHI